MLNVAYLVSHGFAARMVLHSGLIPELREAGFDVAVLCPEPAGEALRGEREIRGGRDAGWDVFTAPDPKSRLRMALTDTRRYLREPVRDNSAIWSRHLYYTNGMAGMYARVRAHMNYAGHRLFYGRGWAHRAFDAFDRRCHRSPVIRRLLAELRPDLLVSTYPVTAFEIVALQEAQRLGITTVGHLLSWDNITCKGRFAVPPEYYIAWGPVMREELSEVYSASAERVFECGVPHFDQHLHMVDTRYRDQVLVDLGLDPCKPYFFFGMSAPIFAPREIEIVEWLAYQVRENRFGHDMQFVIRPHPQNVVGDMADSSWLPRLERLSGNRIAVNKPMLSAGGLKWAMETEDLKVLVNLLSGCSVCLNSGSTLTIDAVIHDKPVVVTLFDGDQELPWWKSARRIGSFPHYRKLLAMGGVQPADSYAALARGLDENLRYPNRRQDPRNQTVKKECMTIDGKSCLRVAKALREIIAMENSSPLSGPIATDGQQISSGTEAGLHAGIAEA